MSNLNIDENTVNKLKDMMNKGELNDVISQIPPEMIQNFSSMMSSNNSKSSENSNGTNNNNSSNNFDFSNIDPNAILKMQSILKKMNNSNDPRSNLLNSLKPYLRDGKKEKLDQYSNFLNMAKIAEILKNDNKEK